jgi:hypothetical protein
LASDCVVSQAVRSLKGAGKQGALMAVLPSAKLLALLANGRTKKRSPATSLVEGMEANSFRVIHMKKGLPDSARKECVFASPLEKTEQIPAARQVNTFQAPRSSRGFSEPQNTRIPLQTRQNRHREAPVLLSAIHRAFV